MGLYGICLAGIELGVFDELMKAVPPDQAVRFAALDQGASKFRGMTGPIAGAVISAAIGIPGGLVVAALVTLAGAASFTVSGGGIAIAGPPRRRGRAAPPPWPRRPRPDRRRP